MLFGNPMIPLFEGKKIIASGMSSSGECGTYSDTMFSADFPQFYDKNGACFVPTSMLDNFIDIANDSILPSRWGKEWRYAAGLYVAHRSKLYLDTYKESSASATEATSGADRVGIIKSATMGDTSVSYDDSAVTAGTEKWGMWNATTYGAQLTTMARSLGIGGIFVV